MGWIHSNHRVFGALLLACVAAPATTAVLLWRGHTAWVLLAAAVSVLGWGSRSAGCVV